MLRTILIVLLVAMVTVPAAAKWEMSEFVIFLGWAEQVECPDDEAMMQALAEADFNTVMWYDEGGLDLAEKYGLKLLFVPSFQDRILEHPANWGYYVADEPATYQFSKVAPTVKQYHQADPNHPAYVNALGSTGEYLHSFMETFQPRVLSYTGGYQWWSPDQRPLHFAKLEAHRVAALAVAPRHLRRTMPRNCGKASIRVYVTVSKVLNGLLVPFCLNGGRHGSGRAG